MARIQERKAAKDYPQQGIKKGDAYFFVNIKTGPRSSRIIRSLTRPKRWELTQSEFYGALWPIEDEGFDSISEASDLQEIAQQIRDLGEEQQAKLDNMPDSLQQADSGQTLERRAEQCGEWADAIEEAANELESELQAFDDAIEPWRAFREKVAAFEKGDGPEPADDEEPDTPLPDELDGVDLTDEGAVAEARQEIINNRVEEATSANPGIE